MILTEHYFKNLDIPDLLISIWCLSSYLNDRTLRKYCRLCQDLAWEKWSTKYMDFTVLMKKLFEKNDKEFNFGNISIVEKYKIYNMIKRYVFFYLFL